MDNHEAVESMTKQRIRPEQITRPIQLLAAWLTGLVLVDGIFLTAATYLSTLTWAAGLLIVAAVVNVPLFLVAIFILQTRFRPEMQEDVYYSKYLEEKQKRIELKTKELKEEIERAISLANVRGELAEEYIKRVTATLDLDEAERTRLRRALRHALSTNEDRVSQNLSRELLEGFQASFLSPQSKPNVSPEATETFLTRFNTLRYEDSLSAHLKVTSEDISEIDLLSSIQRICQVLLKRAEREEKKIELSVPPLPVKAIATRGIFETTLTEILMNAIVYSPKGSTVNVNVSKSGENKIKIEVENPISDRSVQENDIARLFEPGYRGVQSTMLFPAGVGMGLRLVTQSLELIGGSVEIKVANERFVVTVYLASAHEEST